MSECELSPGQRVGDYEIGYKIDTYQPSSLYYAINRSTSEECCIKVIPKDCLRNEELAAKTQGLISKLQEPAQQIFPRLIEVAYTPSALLIFIERCYGGIFNGSSTNDENNSEVEKFLNRLIQLHKDSMQSENHNTTTE